METVSSHLKTGCAVLIVEFIGPVSVEKLGELNRSLGTTEGHLDAPDLIPNGGTYKCGDRIVAGSALR